MAAYEIPLINKTQSLRISLNSVYYRLRVYWNSYSNNWNIDILSDNNISILCGLPLVSNVDLLEQHRHLNLGGRLIAQTDGADAPPTYANLGTTGHLYFVTMD